MFLSNKYSFKTTSINIGNCLISAHKLNEIANSQICIKKGSLFRPDICERWSVKEAIQWYKMTLEKKSLLSIKSSLSVRGS